FNSTLNDRLKCPSIFLYRFVHKLNLNLITLYFALGIRFKGRAYRIDNDEKNFSSSVIYKAADNELGIDLLKIPATKEKQIYTLQH
ncbi:unnamed protein product, partial [Rotaria magnacalcarata]